jgi:threonyl-tRNA synthetase
MKTPYCLVIGDAEMTNGTVTVEHITKGKLGEVSLENLIGTLTKEVSTKS